MTGSTLVVLYRYFVWSILVRSTCEVVSRAACRISGSDHQHPVRELCPSFDKVADVNVDGEVGDLDGAFTCALGFLGCQAQEPDYETEYSTSESRHEHFPSPSLDLSCCCFSLSCG
jgi:hypothetical protein